MKLLLDTHAPIWWWLDHPNLSKIARAQISNQRNEIFASAVSAWEIATKHRLGKLDLPALTLQRYQSLLAADGFQQLAINTNHALLAGSFTQPHRDPFDRILAAQAQIEQLTLISCDPTLAQFGIQPLW